MYNIMYIILYKCLQLLVVVFNIALVVFVVSLFGDSTFQREISTNLFVKDMRIVSEIDQFSKQ